MAAIEEKDVEKTISEDLVVTKYKMAGEIVNSKYKKTFRKKTLRSRTLTDINLNKMTLNPINEKYSSLLVPQARTFTRF